MPSPYFMNAKSCFCILLKKSNYSWKWREKNQIHPSTIWEHPSTILNMSTFHFHFHVCCTFLISIPVTVASTIFFCSTFFCFSLQSTRAKNVIKMSQLCQNLPILCMFLLYINLCHFFFYEIKQPQHPLCKHKKKKRVEISVFVIILSA